jgi:drug/metabolite transporter (DMT)-like permease
VNKRLPLRWPALRLDRHVLALLLVTLVWGLTFPILKIATARLSGVEISALRFLIAAVCMAPFAWGVPRHTWRDGLLLGAMALVSYVAQAYGLQFISSNRSAFITSLNVIMVPLLAWGLGARPAWSVFLAAFLACLGIGLMSFDGGAHLLADASTVLGALACAAYVLFLSRCANAHRPQQLAAAQMCWMALLGCLWMAVDSGLEVLQTLPLRISPAVWGGLLYLGVLASALISFLQASAQRHVPASQAAVIYALEPVFAALFAWLWLSELLSLRAALGAVIVVVAVVLSETQPALGRSDRAP